MANCRSCGAEIIWAKTLSGKAMPLDAEPVLGGRIRLEDGIAYPHSSCREPHYNTHFVTCKFAAQHRRKK